MVAMSLILWLVRHGATDWSDEGRFNGWTDVPLNARGRVQATALGEQLGGRVFDGVWTSDLTRAVETAELSGYPASPDNSLRELDFGSLEGKTFGEIEPALQRDLLAFEPFTSPGGESVRQLTIRVGDFLSELPAGEHVLFTHGGVIRAILRASGHDRSIVPGEVVRASFDATMGFFGRTVGG